MVERLRVTHETSIGKFFKVKGTEGHVNIDGILKQFGIQSHEPAAKIHLERPDDFGKAKSRIENILYGLSPDKHEIFEAAMKDRYPQLTKLADNLPVELSKEISVLADEKIPIRLIKENRGNIDKIVAILGKHTAMGKPSLRISESVRRTLAGLQGTPEIKSVTQELLTSVKLWVPQVSYERGKEITPQKNAGRELVRFLATIE